MPELPPLADDVRAGLPLTVQAYIGALEAWVATPDALDTALARIAALQVQVESLTKQVADLQARLKQTSQNSSRPPSSDPPSAPPRAKKQSRSERKRGGQSNHPGHHRPLKAVAEVDVVEEHWPPTCPQCQSAFPKVAADDIAPLRQQVWEVPEVTPTVTEHRYEAVCCPTCQAVVRAKRPTDVPAGAFGPRLVSLVGLLVGRYRIGANLRRVRCRTLTSDKRS